MHLACLDLEGVLVPEIWINVAERPGSPTCGSPRGTSPTTTS